MATAAATQLAIPGALVGVVSPAVGAPVCDRTVWQRSVLRASLSSAAKLVALALASHTTPADDGYAACSPGLATLVTETGYSRTLVQRQISTLRTRGWLAAVDRPASGRPARFVLSLPEPVARAHGVPTSPAAADASSDLPAAPGVVTGRPSAAARRRARTSGPALAKAATVAADVPGLEVLPAVSGHRLPATAAAPAGEPAVAGGADAEWQILATLARAMRCGQEDFGDAAARLRAVLDSGSWSPAALAIHLVDFVVGGVRVAGADPADSLGWRLDRLPASDRDCSCRSCRSWQQRPAAPASAPVRPASFASPQAGAGSRATPAASAAPAAASAPELAAIEQVAAAGAARARMRATGAA